MPGGALMPITLALLVGFFACLVLAKFAVTLPTVPPGFTEDLVTSVPEPTALAFIPDDADDRMLVTRKPGQLRVYKQGELLQTPALNIVESRVCANAERGLLGVAVDPDFTPNPDDAAGNRYVYLYYTYKKHGKCPVNDPSNPKNPVNRVSRFVMSGNIVRPASEKVLIDNIPSPNGNHNAGDLHFGKDGNLYVSVGDGGCDYAEPQRCQYENDASRDRHILLGKILRITTSHGGIPESNPYRGSSSERCNRTGRTEPGKNCQETFARGFRNPFRMAFDPDAAGTSFRINDVGGSRDIGGWEEIDEGRAGADYGWNLCEGAHDNPERRGNVGCAEAPPMPPIYEYSHSSTGCESIAGGAFVPDAALWPAGYNDAYLFGDFVCNKIFKLTPTGEVQVFADGLGRGGPIAMTFGPYGAGEALYYTTFANGGEVRLIAPPGS
jgi:glucose/arabinose dehydrogenase